MNNLLKVYLLTLENNRIDSRIVSEDEYYDLMLETRNAYGVSLRWETGEEIAYREKMEESARLDEIMELLGEFL